MTKSCATVAVQIHKKMVNDDGFGYSWEERWGYSGDKVKYNINGETFTINRGDYDCSSSTITAWKTAISKTKYAGSLDGATYTGNMRSVFVGSGLFEWKPMSFIAQPGDLYLNEANHVAMCQTQIPDILSEFSWGDNGAYGNRRGDQSGSEAHMSNYYDYPWDGILHYNGKADSDTSQKDPVKPEPKVSVPVPKMRIFRNNSWHSLAEAPAIRGKQGIPIYDVQTLNLGPKGWFKLTIEGGKTLAKNKTNPNHNKKITGITLFYDTPEPKKTGYYCIKYRVHLLNKNWTEWKTDNENGMAGNGKTPIDRIQFKLVKE